MKKLTRIRLINWHYFTDETIEVRGSFLISGENTSGKSTILDAIQLVLTTNTRKFNTAANEKSNRDLKGYVRCKTGDEENAYLRSGSVITYVALEFFEEAKQQAFTLGVKIDSADAESRLKSKWFVEECRLEDLAFLTGGRPSMTEEFRRDDRKVNLISQVSEAKLRFGRRLGNLEDRFFDMIPKSLAFKPMDKVKDFINKFILSQKTIEVVSLRRNINLLKEFEDLMAITKKKIEGLERIEGRYRQVALKEREIRTNDILIKRAEIEEVNAAIAALHKERHKHGRSLEEARRRQYAADQGYESERNRLKNLQIAHANNETTRLIGAAEADIEALKKDHHHLVEKLERLKDMVALLTRALTLLAREGVAVAGNRQITAFLQAGGDVGKKRDLAYELQTSLTRFKETYSEAYFTVKSELSQAMSRRLALEKEIQDLRDKKLSYPLNTRRLKEAIEEEFERLGIKSPVRIFSDLLEITDKTWHNAIEGYLNNQRFYLIVAPEHYPAALGVYHRIKKEVHSVGLVNTGKLDLDAGTDPASLAYLISSDNRYAKAYANHLLGRVVRCGRVEDLKDHLRAITPEGMVYQNFAVKRIDEKVYRTPFIGAGAYKVQLEAREKEYEGLRADIDAFETRVGELGALKSALEACRMAVIDENIEVPLAIETVIHSMGEKEAELQRARNNPNYIEIQQEIEACQRRVEQYREEYQSYRDRETAHQKDLEYIARDLERQEEDLKTMTGRFEALCEEDLQATEEGLGKFDEQRKTKSPQMIVRNYSPHRKGLESKKAEFSDELIRLQSQFCSAYECDFETGPDSIHRYKEELHRLTSSDLIKYEDQLNKARQDCELEFKESFLARLKENIESARLEFKSLNKALKGIYYGEDSYRFELTGNKKKESLYRMIMDEQNQRGFSLWTETFGEEYREEMRDLFDKLTAYDDLGDRVIEEYTDYRSYLDYDIIVEKRDGGTLRFSNIYGEKSGGETQTPYYVAIAASFVQLYRSGDTIRIIMLDEAFDKMDDNRIAAMMDFFNSQDFQIILATPPAKMEVIGDKVDTILMALREGNHAMVEVYDYEQ